MRAQWKQSLSRAAVYAVLILLCTSVGLAGHFYENGKEEAYENAIEMAIEGQAEEAVALLAPLGEYKYAQQTLAYCNARAVFVATDATTYAPTLAYLSDIGEKYDGKLREKIEAFRAEVIAISDLYREFGSKHAAQDMVLPRAGMREQSLLLPPFPTPDGIVRHPDGQSVLYRWYAPCEGAWMCTALVEAGEVTRVELYRAK